MITEATPDFFSLEPLLIARLRATVTGIRVVLSGMDMDGLLDLPQQTPAIYVLYSDYGIADQVDADREARITQTWLVVVAVQSVRTPKSGTDVRHLAGPLLGNVLQSLLGWQPDSAHMPLQLETAPRWSYQPPTAKQQAGLLHIPLAFSTTLFLTGSIL
jgi:hypothetical protein